MVTSLRNDVCLVPPAGNILYCTGNAHQLRGPAGHPGVHLHRRLSRHQRSALKHNAAHFIYQSITSYCVMDLSSPLPLRVSERGVSVQRSGGRRPAPHYPPQGDV